MTHENITAFIGACIDSPNICVLTSYCSKGTLQVVYTLCQNVQWRIVGSRGPGPRHSVGPLQGCDPNFPSWGLARRKPLPTRGFRGRAPEAKHFGNNILKIG